MRFGCGRGDVGACGQERIFLLDSCGGGTGEALTGGGEPGCVCRELGACAEQFGIEGFGGGASRDAADGDEVGGVEGLAEDGGAGGGVLGVGGEEALDVGGHAFGVVGAGEGLDGVGDEVVGGAEGHAGLADEGVGQFGDGEEASLGGGGHVGGVELGFGEDAGEEVEGAEAVLEGGVDEGLQVVLGVVHVGEGGVVEAAEDGLGLGHGAAGEDAYMLQGDGIALLGHDAADLDEAVAEAQEVELGGAPEEEVLGEAAEVEHGDGEHGAAFGEVVDGGDGTVGVDLEGVEAEQRGGVVAVDGEAGGGDGAGAEGGLVDPGEGGEQAGSVAFEALDHCHEVVAEGGGLGGLVVGVGGHEAGAVGAREGEQGAAEGGERGDGGEEEVAKDHAVHGEVDVVAAAGGVHAAGVVGAAEGGKTGLDEEEEVFRSAVVGGGADGGEVEGVEGAEAAEGDLGREDALAGEHEGVGVVDVDEGIEEEALGVGEDAGEDGGAVGWGREGWAGGRIGVVVRHGSPCPAGCEA